MPQLVYIPIKAIIFDFDGTLVDTKHYYFGLLAQYLQVDLTLVISKADEITFSKLTSQERNVKWKIVKALYKVSRALEFGYFKSLRALFYVIRNQSKQFSLAQPTKDAVIALKRLHSSGIKLAIVSDSPRKKIEIFITNHLKDTSYFSPDRILASGEFGKHKEEGFVHFMRKFQLTNTPRSCAIIGDLGGDIIAGKTVRVTTFGFAAGYSSPDTLMETGPDGIYETLLEMEGAVHLFLAEEK
ncbi:MAG: HAD family hydrolase [Candidatus Heimdallarchaeota archaeon]|nr:MAG: HAD family hydrolase [Candidatus Heimdallarchaeota archaeon]